MVVSSSDRAAAAAGGSGARLRMVRCSMRFSAFGTWIDALDVDAGRVDVVGIELAGLDQVLDLGDGHLARRSPSSD